MPRKSIRSKKQSPAARITAAIIEKLQAGTKPWVQPWRGLPVSRPLRHCGTPYRGMNTFWLWMVAEAGGFQSPSRQQGRAALSLWICTVGRRMGNRDRTEERRLWHTFIAPY